MAQPPQFIGSVLKSTHDAPHGVAHTSTAMASKMSVASVWFTSTDEPSETMSTTSIGAVSVTCESVATSTPLSSSVLHTPARQACGSQSATGVAP